MPLNLGSVIRWFINVSRIPRILSMSRVSRIIFRISRITSLFRELLKILDYKFIRISKMYRICVITSLSRISRIIIFFITLESDYINTMKTTFDFNFYLYQIFKRDE